MESECSNALGDAGLHVHQLHGLSRESSSPHGEFGCMARCAGLGEARVREAMGSRQQTKLDFVDRRYEQLVIQVGENASARACQAGLSCAAQLCGRRAWLKRSRGFNVDYVDILWRAWVLCGRTARRR